MKIGVTGASGLIGKQLCRSFESDGLQVVRFSREGNPVREGVSQAAIAWNPMEQAPNPDHLSGLDAVVHLAGEPIARRRWSPKQQQLIRDSRILGTRHLVESWRECPQPPRVLISASATGFYGNRKAEELDETSERGDGFLADVCVEWENEALAAADLGVRVVLLRTGIVLDGEGGALPKMLLPFKAYVGGALGSGEQFMSWIHLEDEIRLIRFALLERAIKGPLNATAPNPASNRAFTAELCRILQRPQMPAVPGFVVRTVLGEMGKALLLEGQRVFPRKALEAGFSFKYPDLGETLQAILG